MNVALAPALALVTSIVCLPSMAQADWIEVVGDDEARATELAHTVDITVEPGLAVLRVQRTIVLAGKGSADVALHASLPLGGVVTAVSVQGPGQVEAQDDSGSALFFFPDVKVRSKRTVSYRVEVPLIANGASATIWLPQVDDATTAMAPVVRLGGEILLPEDNPVWDPVQVPQPAPAGGRARWGIAPLPSGWLWRTEVDAPARLGEPADQAHVVFVLDVSRSQARRGIEVQLELLQQWARQMPRARYQVVAYHRDADLVFSTWKDAGGIRDLGLGHAKLVPHNGSNLDGALELAASVAKEARGRVFVLIGTDGETPVTSPPARMAARLDGADGDLVTHLILASGRHTRGALERRADEHRLAVIASHHGGMPVHVYLPPRWTEPPAVEALRALFRVLRIDRFDTLVDGKAQLGARAGRHLYEGQSAVSVGRAATEPKSVVPTGVAWSTPWQQSSVRTAAVDRRAALFAVRGLDRTLALTEAELQCLGRKLRFVTAKTALKATRAGTEVIVPSETGVEPRGAQGTGRGAGEPAQTKPPGEIAQARVRELFGALYAPCIDNYRGEPVTLQISLEMSWNEILDVSAVGADTATNLCVEEAVWAVDLPDDFRDPHAFGMLEEPLTAPADSASPADDSQAPPETYASGSGGCGVRGGGPSAPWSTVCLLLWLACPRPRRETTTTAGNQNRAR